MTAWELQNDLDLIRTDLHTHFGEEFDKLTAALLSFADELDESYTAIKKSKIAGATGGIVGGILGVVGFGLSFATFGASLGLCIAGGVIAGAGGATSSGAYVADLIKARVAKNKANEKLDKFNKSTEALLEKFKELSMRLAQFGNMDNDFSSWVWFWGILVCGSIKTGLNFGYNMVASTVMNIRHLVKASDIAGDISSAAVPFVRTLGQTARGLHIAGGAVGVVLLPFDLYSLVRNSVDLHKNTAHKDSKRIRDIVEKLKEKCPSMDKIDDMIDETIAALN